MCLILNFMDFIAELGFLSELVQENSLRDFRVAKSIALCTFVNAEFYLLKLSRLQHTSHIAIDSHTFLIRCTCT